MMHQRLRQAQIPTEYAMVPTWHAWHGGFALAVVVLSSQAPAADAVKGERKALGGTWQATAYDQGNNKNYDRLVKGMSWTFDGDKLSWSLEGKAELQGTYTIDPGQKPKRIDLRDEKGKHDCLGVYELDGDTLKLRFQATRDGRPKALESEKGAKRFFITFKRVKG